MANSDGIIGLATNNSAYVAQTSKIFGDTETNLLALIPCSKFQQTSNTYGALFSIFGAATSFTQTEAETMVNALNTFFVLNIKYGTHISVNSAYIIEDTVNKNNQPESFMI